MNGNNVVVLFKGGRLPSWHSLDTATKNRYEQTHVDLMLSVACERRMIRLEGYQLIDKQEYWRNFWVIEFPDLFGAETWINAEIQPPYGAYGRFEYHFARNWVPEYLKDLVVEQPAKVFDNDHDPHRIPELKVDKDSLVVLNFGRDLDPGRFYTGDITHERHSKVLSDVAEQHHLSRLEGFRLITPQPTWQWMYMAEFPSLAGAEAWIETETIPDRQISVASTWYLTRRWAPGYFDLWTAR